MGGTTPRPRRSPHARSPPHPASVVRSPPEDTNEAGEHRGDQLLSDRDRELLDAGPRPWERLDYQRRPSAEEREAHAKAYSRARARALVRGKEALNDLAWLVGTLDLDFVRALVAHATPRGDETFLEIMLKEAIGKAGWSASVADRILVFRMTGAIAAGSAQAHPGAPPPTVSITFPNDQVPAPVGLDVSREIGPRNRRRPLAE